MAKIVGRANQFTLTISLTTSEGDIPTNADSTPTAAITTDAGSPVVSFPAASVSNPSTGTYRITWTPSQTGSYVLTWTFLIDGSTFQNTESFTVVRVTSASDASENVEPDVGYASTCKVTGTFLNARGDYQVGVHVRFTPAIGTNQVTPLGIISRETTAQTDTEGRLEMYLLPGQSGTLAISGMGLVREVTVPDETEIDIFELIADTDDPLAVQVANTNPLIRRSLP